MDTTQEATGWLAMSAALSGQGVAGRPMILKVDPGEFLRLFTRTEGLLVVTSQSKRKWWEAGRGDVWYEYMTAYKGFLFATISLQPLPLPGTVEVTRVDRIPIPRIWGYW